jgi:hypothetical protein
VNEAFWMRRICGIEGDLALLQDRLSAAVMNICRR